MLVLLLLLAAGTSDDRVRNDAITAVSRYPQFTIFDDVSVHAREGVVTLTGKVTEPVKKGDIGTRVAAVAGVQEVVNQLVVLPASPVDDELRRHIARAIYGNANFWNYAVMPNPPIHIIVEHSRVTLTGMVRSDADRVLAGALARQSGAVAVVVDLRTEAEMRRARD